MIKIVQIWFEGEWMYGRDADGNVYRQSYLWYPRLYLATPEQRNAYELGIDGAHWRSIDEDISFDSFIDRRDIEPNPMQRFFLTHREMNVSGIAKKMNLNPSLLAGYVYGWKKPSAKRVKEIEEGIRAYGRQLAETTFT